MNEFVKHEEVYDYCSFRPINRIEYPIFKKLNYSSWSDEKEEIQTTIETYGNAKRPSEKQIETLNFIIKNENQIFKSIFPYYKNVILPSCIKSLDMEEDVIVQNEKELNKILGINEIEVLSINNPKSFYFLIQFDFSYDDEHGLYLMFRETEIIDFFGIGDKDYDAINIRENGLKSDDDKPLGVKIRDMNGKELFQGEYYFDQKIDFQLKKGYFLLILIYTMRGGKASIDLVVNSKKNLNNFTIEEILK